LPNRQQLEMGVRVESGVAAEQSPGFDIKIAFSPVGCRASLHPDECAVFYGGALDGIVEQDCLPGYVIQRELDALSVIGALAVCRNLNETVRLIHYGGCGPHAFEGVALLAAGGADIVGLVADADVVIEGTCQRMAGQSGAVVPHAETVLVKGDFDDWWRPLHL